VAVLVLDKFSQASGITVAAATSLNAGRDAVTTINTTWLSIVVLIGIASVIILMLVRSFGGGSAR
jgi:hypothetical protein